MRNNETPVHAETPAVQVGTALYRAMCDLYDNPNIKKELDTRSGSVVKMTFAQAVPYDTSSKRDWENLLEHAQRFIDSYEPTPEVSVEYGTDSEMFEADSYTITITNTQ